MVDRLAQLLAENNEVLLRKVQNMIDNSIDNRVAMLRAPEREPRRLANNGGITCEDTTGGQQQAATLMLATERGEIQFGVEANVNLYAAPASGSGTAILKTDNTFSAANVVTAGGADVNEIATAVGADAAKIAANAAKIAALEKRWEERDSNDD